MLDKVGRFLAHVLTAIITLIVVSAATAIVLLARGPVSLTTATPYVEAALNDAEAPIRIGFEETILAWEPKRRRVEVRVLELWIAGAGGRVIATAPAMSVDLDPFALISGRIEPERVTLLAPLVRLVRNVEGGIELGLGGDAGEGDDLVDSWLKGDIPDATRSLKRISIVDADLLIDDQLTGRRWRAARSTLALTRGQAGTSIEVAAELEVDGRPARLNVNALYRDPIRPIALDFAFTGISPGFLAREFGLTEIQPLAAVDVPLAGRITANLTSDMSLIELKFEVNGVDGHLTLPGLYPRPLGIEKLHARGRLENLGERVVIEAIDVSFVDGPTSRFQGTFHRAAEGLGIKGTVELSAMEHTRLTQLWPRGLEDNARAWVAKKIRGGVVRRTRVRIDISPEAYASGELGAEALVLDFVADNVAVDYMEGFPQLRNARGVGRIDTNHLEVKLESGRTGGVELSEGTVAIDLRDREDISAALNFRATAPAAAAFELLSRPPVDLGRRFAIEPGGIDGKMDARVELIVPLEKDVRVEDIRYRASAKLEALSIPAAFEGLAVGDGVLDLTVEEDGVDANGKVALNRVPVSVNWRREFSEGSEFPSRYGLAAVLDDDARKALGISLDGYVSGPVSAKLQLSRHKSGRYEGAAALNLKEGEVRLDAVNWKKAKGIDGTAKFSFIHGTEGTWTFTDFRLESEKATFVGAGVFSKALRRIEVRRARFHGNDITAEIDIAPDGARKISVAGRVFDLRPMIDALEAPVGEAPIEIDAKIMKLIVSDSHAIGSATARALGTEGDWRELAVAGRLNDSAPIDLKITPADETHRKVVIESPDAGSALAASGYLSSIIGGRLKIEARMRRKQSVDGLMLEGDVRIDDFILAQASVLSQALAADSLEEIRKLVKDQGIVFDRFVAPFQMTPSRIILPEGRAKGPTLVLTIAGFVDRDRDLIDFKGAIAPSHGINTALGEIPVLGKIFVGRKGEGIFAMSYKVKGSAASPSIRMNPLTALAPGFLRRIVEALGEPVAPGAAGTPEYPSGGEN